MLYSKLYLRTESREPQDFLWTELASIFDLVSCLTLLTEGLRLHGKKKELSLSDPPLESSIVSASSDLKASLACI